MHRYGRIAFACAGGTLQQLEADVQAAGFTVHTPYVSLDTPGKATVQVVILQDPDGHEVRARHEGGGGGRGGGGEGRGQGMHGQTTCSAGYRGSMTFKA